MWRIIEDGSDIANAQKRFTDAFKQISDDKVSVHFGHLGASFYREVLWMQQLDIWVHSDIIEGSRHYNGFGIENPRSSTHVSITCEINFPLSGINRRIAGAFAGDRSGGIHIVHRGKVGGGRRGIGKALFEENYGGNWATVKDGDLESRVAVLAALDSTKVPEEVSQFVYEIHRIKGLI